MMPLGRRKVRWKDNTRSDLKGAAYECVERIHLTQARDHGNEPLGSLKDSQYFDQLSHC
jgi:hypothetical protein